MTTFTASSELGPELAFSTDAISLSSDSGSNLPPPPPDLLVSRHLRVGGDGAPGRRRPGLSSPSPLAAARFYPPFRIG